MRACTLKAQMRAQEIALIIITSSTTTTKLYAPVLLSPFSHFLPSIHLQCLKRKATSLWLCCCYILQQGLSYDFLHPTRKCCPPAWLMDQKDLSDHSGQHVVNIYIGCQQLQWCNHLIKILKNMQTLCEDGPVLPTELVVALSVLTIYCC
jgi:hypothetical protein